MKDFLKNPDHSLKKATFYDDKVGAVEKYKENTLSYRKDALGHEQAAALDPENPEALQNLQRIKLTLGEAAKALEYNQGRLRILKEAHGDKPHLDVADCKNDIGSALGELGRYEEALTYQMQALELNKEIFGDKHPKVAFSIDSVGSTLKKLGRYEEALVYEKQALELRKK